VAGTEEEVLMGWIGSGNELMHVFRTFGVDHDEDGKFHVDGKIVSFMGAGDEFVVGDDAVAYIEGKPRNICSMLEVTSYGKKVVVV
jgi:hypothetical protein